MKRPLSDQVDTLYWVIENQRVSGWDVAVDVGASSGRWTQIMAANFKKVIAFEPCKENAEIILGRGLSNVEFHNVAVMDRPGRVSMERSPKRLHKFQGQFAVPNPNGLTEAITLDSLSLEQCNLLKIDVEGAELLVLMGARGTILRCKPTIIVEIKGGKLPSRYELSAKMSAKYLNSIGYKRIFARRPDVVFTPR